METPGDRIVKELEQLPHKERMEVVEQVLERLGIAQPTRAESRSGAKRAWLAVALGALGVGVTWWVYTATNARGRLELTTDPAEATVFIDGHQVHDQPRTPLRLKPGPHTLSVTMPGYGRSDRDIVIATDQTLHVAVKLELSWDTGFEITSDPPSMRLWLDGQPVMAGSEPARTNFRVARIPPGRHVLELKDEGQRLYWRKAVMIEPDQIARIHAVMVPTSESGLFK